jgi:2-polyprenyl-6-methoxyphenol hydroxylase-like FAD-dependent oxidoreductase
MLALLLARKGVQVTLLEAHKDFSREFRGNTINPAVVQIMAELGLVDQLMQLPHAKINSFTVQTGDGPLTFADFSRLKTRYPYIMMLPQARFLEFVVNEAQQYPNFRLLMGARVEGLIQEAGVTRGVRYRTDEGSHELHALLTVGADGRFSRIRRLAHMTPVATATPMDVLWFNLPRYPGDPEQAGAVFRFGSRSLVVMMDHGDYWQVGYIIAKGSYPQLKAAGLPALRQNLAELLPELDDRVDQIRDWQQGSLLSVESSCLHRWYQPGLLLIGDAAHVMSPVGGVGINHAIQDAVVAANVLADPLKARCIELRHLAAVQRKRREPTRIIQLFQSFLHRWGVDGALNSNQPFTLPAFLKIALRLPIIRTLPAWLIAFGAWPVHVRN